MVIMDDLRRGFSGLHLPGSMYVLNGIGSIKSPKGVAHHIILLHLIRTEESLQFVKLASFNYVH